MKWGLCGLELVALGTSVAVCRPCLIEGLCRCSRSDRWGTLVTKMEGNWDSCLTATCLPIARNSSAISFKALFVPKVPYVKWNLKYFIILYSITKILMVSFSFVYIFKHIERFLPFFFFNKILSEFSLACF